jgi:hypothetical protein
MTHKEQLREQMREAYESVMILEAQTKIIAELARNFIIPKDEALKDMDNALVEVKALRERHTSLRIQWEGCDE